MFGTELVYTVVIMVLCLVIYYKTKEMYDLTKYTGINYFRNAFLFFGLAYIVRFLLHMMMISRVSFDLFLPMRQLMAPLLALIGYFSTMAIFCLVYSLVWKKIAVRRFLWFSHSIAITISLATVLTHSHFILAMLQFVLLLFAAILSFAMHQKSRKSHMRLLYILVVLFWLLNLYLIGPRRFVPFELNLLFQALSLVVFLLIYRKVTKWVQ